MTGTDTSDTCFSRSARRAAIALVLLLGLVASARANESQPETLSGVALVIGNSDYEHLPALSNPQNDARAIEELLSGLGFETGLSSDRDARRLARDLENFAEDAGGADVAVLYYAGHGIEAGGENFLVPVDADFSALDAAGEHLVPLSRIVARLRARVPVTIVMLDACRDNPFPARATLKLTPDAKPRRISASGLIPAAARSASAIVPTGGDRAVDSLGIVIGFAAEPGHAALDGDPGGNSPYAAAILRHLGAMAGADFGTVMRMVAEEVWLKTGGRQRPWVNESLRRQLYFGEAPATPGGVEGDLLDERRRLLVTISALPDFGRARVQRIAAQNGVPMDALFGLLNAMGAEAPHDPARLEEVLKSESARIRQIISARQALASPDPEVTRLTALADSAEREGLIESAKRLRERAKQRDAEFQAAVVDSAEEQVKAQRLASAQVFARSAETYLLAFEHLNAAADFARAYERVERWDRDLAWEYRFRQFRALTDQGDVQGDNDAFERAFVIGRDALRLAGEFDDRARWASTQNEIGHALRKLGERETGTDRLLLALEAFEQAASHRSRESAPLEWAETQADRARALARIAERESGPERLHEAVAVYRAALEVFPRQQSPREWANIQIALGGALGILGNREQGPESFYQAVDALKAAIAVLSPQDDPFLWANTHDSLATAYSYIAERTGDTAMLEEAVEIYRQALAVARREQFPFYWAGINSNLGNALRLMGQQAGKPEFYGDSIEHIRGALEVWTREEVPMDWARAQSSLAVSLVLLNGWQDGTDGYEAAIAALRGTLEEWTREKVPLEWANASNSLALAIQFLAVRRQDVELLHEAIAIYRSVLEVWTRDTAPLQWAKTQHNLGIALATFGENAHREAALLDAAAAYSAALEVRTPELTPLDWGHSASKLGMIRAYFAHAAGDLEAMREAYDLVAEVIERVGDVDDHHAVALWKRDLTNIGMALDEMEAAGVNSGD